MSNVTPSFFVLFFSLEKRTSSFLQESRGKDVALLESSRAGAKQKTDNTEEEEEGVGRGRRKKKGGGGERKLLPVRNLNRSTEIAAAANSKAHVTTLTTSPVLLAVAALNIVIQFRWSSSISFFQYPTERQEAIPQNGKRPHAITEAVHANTVRPECL